MPVGFQGLGTVASLVRGGKLRLVGVSMAHRHPQFPDVPTVSESGLPGFRFNSWFTLMAPAATPREIIGRLHAELVKVLTIPDVREKLAAQGFTPVGSTPEELATATREQLARYAALMKQAGIKSE